MGKSPGKWIKSVFFGKKHSKCSSSNSATVPNKLVPIEIPAEDNSPVISDPSQLVENGAANNSSTVNRDLEVQHKFVSVSLNADEMRRQCEAATKVQAAFRGYLARRAFRALHGIIRLQALIRGLLVRRQAVATLHCMQAILKLQALSRGQTVDIGANTIFGLGRLATNVYVLKLHLSLPAAIPLSLQYNTDESNSRWNWLKRWSSSRFWDQPTHARKVPYVKPRIKQIGSQNTEAEPGKSKRTSRRSSMGDIGPLSSFETNKPKQNPKKVEEQASSELERVKRNLRKVSGSLTCGSENLETKDEKMNVSEPKVLENGGKIETARFSADELSSKGDEKDYHKEDNGREIGKRRSISLNQTRLPSYMMVTESAKAKLRLSQVSSVELTNGDDGMKAGYARRHSLPASTNGKVGNGKANRYMASSKDDKELGPGWRR